MIMKPFLATCLTVSIAALGLAVTIDLPAQARTTITTDDIIHVAAASTTDSAFLLERAKTLDTRSSRNHERSTPTKANTIDLFAAVDVMHHIDAVNRHIAARQAARQEARQQAREAAAAAAAAEQQQQESQSTPAPSPSPPSYNTSSGGVGYPWSALSMCESGGNWAYNGSSGYDGGLQFLPSTWTAFGGGQYAPYAYEASASEQVAIAEKVLASSGWGAWPTCSSQLGLR